MENELYHSGRKGMKWGQHIFCGRNCSKHGGKGKSTKGHAEEETVEQKKERILKSRSAKELYNNADLFTTQELNNAYTRLVLERNIKSLAPAEVSRGQKFVNDFTSKGENAHKVFDVTSKLYNDGAKVYNTFFKGDGDPLPLIKDNDKKPEKKADGGKSDKKVETKPDKSNNTKTEKANTGDVVGDGNSSKTAKATKRTTPETVDAEWNDIPISDLATTNSYSAGRDYVNYLLDYTDED